jgi:uncharacterized protein
LSAAFLLDVNVLLAMMWPEHEAHNKVQQWLRRHAREGWATCPFTQTAFVRILANPAFSPHSPTPPEAFALLQSNLANPSHSFWADAISFEEATRPFRHRILGHRQVSDAYLLGLAIHRGGRLATLDRSIPALLEDETERPRATLVI